MKGALKILFRGILYLTISVSALVIVLLGSFLVLNYTNNITNSAKYFLNRNIAGKIQFENLRFGFSEFPVVDVYADNGYLISSLNKIPTDTLGRFDKIEVKMDISYLFADSLTLYFNRVNVTNGFALVTIDKDGTPGWNVWRFKAPKTEQEKRLPHHYKEKMYINEVHLRGENRFLYHNNRRNRHFDISSGNLDLLGSIRIKYKEIYVDSLNVEKVKAKFYLNNGKTIIGFNSPRVILNSTLTQDKRNYSLEATTTNTILQLFGNEIFNGNDKVRLSIATSLSSPLNKIDIQELDIFLNDFTKFEINGSYLLHPSTSDLRIKMSTPDIMATLNDFKIKLSNKFTSYKYHFPVDVDATMKGKIGFKNKIYPPVDISFESKGGYLYLDKYNAVRNINLRASLKYQHPKLNDLDVKIENCDMIYRNSKLSVKGLIYDVLVAPIADGILEGILNLGDFSPAVNKEMNLKGKMSVKANFKFNLKSQNIIANSKIGFLETSNLTNVSFLIPNTNARVSIPSAKFYYRDNIEKNDVTVGMSIDSANVVSQGEADINFYGINTEADISYEGDSYFPNLNNGMLKFRRATSVSPGNDTIAMRRFLMKYDFTAPKKGITEMSYFAILENLSFLSSDSIGIFIKEIGIESKADFVEGVNFGLGERYKLWDIIGTWAYSGVLRMREYKATMPQMPLLANVPLADITFTQDDAVLNIPQGSVGSSVLWGNFRLNNWHKYVFNDSLLNLRASVGAKKIDMNELLPAVLKGASFSQNRKLNATKKSPFVTVPNNLDVNFKVNALNTQYGNVLIDTLTANINIANSVARFNNIKFVSDVARMKIDFSYSTLQPQVADANLNLDLRNLSVDQVFLYAPQITKTKPFLSSVKGVFDAQINATWNIDSLMQIEKSSLTSNAHVLGTNLRVNKDDLMPEFVGYMLFGKAQLLTIDTLNLHTRIKDNILTIEPMTFNLNNYKVGVTGLMENNSFFYHLALLKAPLPIKFGIDIIGDFSKHHFRITKQRAKSESEMLKSLDKIDKSTPILSKRFTNINFSNPAINSSYPIIYDEVRNLIIEGEPLSQQEIDALHNNLLESLQNRKLIKNNPQR